MCEDATLVEGRAIFVEHRESYILPMPWVDIKLVLVGQWEHRTEDTTLLKHCPNIHRKEALIRAEIMPGAHSHT